MDTRLTIASKRDTRTFDPRPVTTEHARAVLDAGRLAGSGMNRQPWRFVVVGEGAALEALAPATYSPDMLRRAPLRVAIVTRPKGLALFDCGRAAQSMLLAAWDLGVVSCPTGLADPEAASAAIGLADGEQVVVVLCLGYPERPRDPARRSIDDWSARARRRALDEIVDSR